MAEASDASMTDWRTGQWRQGSPHPLTQPQPKAFFQPVNLQLGNLDFLEAKPRTLAQVMYTFAEAGGAGILFGYAHGVTHQFLGQIRLQAIEHSTICYEKICTCPELKMMEII